MIAVKLQPAVGVNYDDAKQFYTRKYNSTTLRNGISISQSVKFQFLKEKLAQLRN